MTKVLFICHGNICRSPMAEFVFRDLVERAGKEKDFLIDSAATSREEIGNDIYPPVKKILRQKNIDFSMHSARQITKEDLSFFDYIIAMERYNIRNLEKMFGTVAIKKVCLLMDFTDRPGDVSDPWYSGDFDTAFRDIRDGCTALFAHISRTESFSFTTAGQKTV